MEISAKDFLPFLLISILEDNIMANKSTILRLRKPLNMKIFQIEWF